VKERDLLKDVSALDRERENAGTEDTVSDPKRENALEKRTAPAPAPVGRIAEGVVLLGSNERISYASLFSWSHYETLGSQLLYFLHHTYRFACNEFSLR
jgi:hypothetical protein